LTSRLSGERRRGRDTPTHATPRHAMPWRSATGWGMNPLTGLRGTFVEFRNGMINVSPIGRGCS
jgi:hypothetical protein